MMKYTNYIFDLDGTLLNTIDDLALSCNYALRTYGMPEYTVNEIQQFVGNGIKKLMERAVQQGVNNSKFDEIFTCFQEYYLRHNEINTRPYDGIAELLETLKQNGKRIAVVSNKFDPATKALVRKYFGAWATVAIGEHAGMNKKPAPDMVYAAMKELGCTAERTVYVGDSDVDIETAKNSGLPCISVLWGFRTRSFLIEHGATTLVSRPVDILEI